MDKIEKKRKQDPDFAKKLAKAIASAQFQTFKYLTTITQDNSGKRKTKCINYV